MWDDGSLEIVGLEPNPNTVSDGEALANVYKLPKRLENVVSAQILKYELDRDNYRRVLHQLLFAEEMFMRKQLSRYGYFVSEPAFLNGLRQKRGTLETLN